MKNKIRVICHMATSIDGKILTAHWQACKSKTENIKLFRTLTGADIYARIEGFVPTARKNIRNVFSELYATFEGRNFITA